MSIPRDLYVDIPGASTGRINSTLLIEGPETLIATVRETFGIEINHYVVLDFYGFREVVDELGGVPVWFEYPSRSRDQTGLQIVEPGCHVLDGVDALRYVRTRDYEQFIDGSWVQVGNSDFGRIERQQDFLVLTLDRAIQRGARNPRTLASLVEAGAQSVELDQALTVAELADLGGFFADFDPENLARFTPEVTTEYDGSRYLGEVLKPDVNEEIYAVFRGQAGGLAPSDVELHVVVSDATHLD
jgi:LCP family protein required for cell wall assembly